MEFRLRADKRALERNRGEWTKNLERFEALPDVPDDMRVIEGAHSTVALHAARLNQIQFDNGRLDYLFSPDIIVKEAA